MENQDRVIKSIAKHSPYYFCHEFITSNEEVMHNRWLCFFCGSDKEQRHDEGCVYKICTEILNPVPEISLSMYRDWLKGCGNKSWSYRDEPIIEYVDSLYKCVHLASNVKAVKDKDGRHLYQCSRCGLSTLKDGGFDVDPIEIFDDYEIRNNWLNLQMKAVYDLRRLLNNELLYQQNSNL